MADMHPANTLENTTQTLLSNNSNTSIRYENVVRLADKKSSHNIHNLDFCFADVAKSVRYRIGNRCVILVFGLLRSSLLYKH